MKTHDEMMIDSLFTTGGTFAGLQQAVLVNQSFENGILKTVKNENVFLSEQKPKRKNGKTTYTISAETYTLESSKPYSHGDIISYSSLDFHGTKHEKRTVLYFV